MINTEQLTQDTSNKYDEEWRVVLTSKGEYTLSKNQAIILKQEIAGGNRATVMFETFAIPVPYVVEFYRVRKFLKDSVQLPSRASEKPYKPVSKERWAKLRKEIVKKIG